MAEFLQGYQPDNTLNQLIRYTFVGVISFMVDFGTLFTLTEIFKLHYLVSAAVAFFLGLMVNYMLSIIWVFNKRSLANKWMEFALFLLIGLVGLGLNELFMWSFTDLAHLHYMLSKIVSTAFVYLWNFFARKYTLFS